MVHGFFKKAGIPCPDVVLSCGGIRVHVGDTPWSLGIEDETTIHCREI